MRNILFTLLLLSSTTFAGQITVPLSDEYVSGDTKYCIYSHGGEDYTDTVRASRECKYTETFDTDK